MLSNLFWGSPQQEEQTRGVEDLKHTTKDEGDWLLVSYNNKKSSDSNSRGGGGGHSASDCEVDSVCSDSSWVITPAPTFQRSAGSAHNTSGSGEEDAHSFEDLLIEHPTMSVYHCQNSSGSEEATMAEEDSASSPDVAQPGDVVGDVAGGVAEEERNNQNRELALVQNRQRQQLAATMDIPLNMNSRKGGGGASKSGSGKPPKLTRRALKRHNPMSRIGVKHQVQKCGFKAGRRRC